MSLKTRSRLAIVSDFFGDGESPGVLARDSSCAVCRISGTISSASALAAAIAAIHRLFIYFDPVISSQPSITSAGSDGLLRASSHIRDNRRQLRRTRVCQKHVGAILS